MKVAFLVVGKEMPSTRFRVLQYLPFLEAKGARWRIFFYQQALSLTALKKPRRLLRYIRALGSGLTHDLVFLQKPGFVVHRWIYLRLLFALGRRVIFDFDDAIFIDRLGGGPQPRAMMKKLEYILRRSRVVIAGNPVLAEYAGAFNPRVEIIPTPVDCERYSPAPNRPEAQPLTIGWMGTAANLGYMARLRPVISRILMETGARFLIVSDHFQKPSGLDLNFGPRIEFRRWQESRELDDLRQFDIGLMPLDDDPYTRGKCGYKLLLCMAVAVPVVASPVGINSRIVEEGINGFLAATEEEWLDKLLRLCHDGNLRRRMGAANREKVIREYSLPAAAREWIALLERTAAER
ncbi:MAG: glycosyltransferase family 4 protein [Candidatus Aminicenantes bacterium]|nr:glycosyltransferase family 4 protein [Candidatus Aminicenantes bacterium]